jgi:Cys-rich four helix bundle protein (predicted Tat secretion target)
MSQNAVKSSKSRRLFMQKAAVIVAGITTLRISGMVNSPAHSQTQKTIAKPKSLILHQAIVDAAKSCISKGESCRRHCIRTIRSGDNSLQDCLRAIEAMLPVCQAMSRLAVNNASRLKDLGKVCLDVCRDCEAECIKHAGHHAECKACKEACSAMITTLQKLLSS